MSDRAQLPDSYDDDLSREPGWTSIQCATGLHLACGPVGVALGCDCDCHDVREHERMQGDV